MYFGFKLNTILRIETPHWEEDKSVGAFSQFAVCERARLRLACHLVCFRLKIKTQPVSFVFDGKSRLIFCVCGQKFIDCETEMLFWLNKQTDRQIISMYVV